MSKLYLFIAMENLTTYKITVFAEDGPTARIYLEGMLEHLVVNNSIYNISRDAFTMSILKDGDIYEDYHARHQSTEKVYFSVFDKSNNEVYCLGETKDNLVCQDKLPSSQNHNSFSF